MMIQIVFFIMALSVCSLLLYWLFPLLDLTRLTTTDYIDEDDPINASYIALGNLMFLIMGVVGFLVSGFLLISEGLKRDPYD